MARPGDASPVGATGRPCAATPDGVASVAKARGRAPDVRPGPEWQLRGRLRDGVGLLGADVDRLADGRLAPMPVGAGDRLERGLDVVVTDALDVLGTGQAADLGDERLASTTFGSGTWAIGVRRRSRFVVAFAAGLLVVRVVALVADFVAVVEAVARASRSPFT
ncbi:hypothetical protein BH23CHL8_BH23CHL8_31940 [soil metagenome]